jgi:hypothetical protein
MILFVESLGCLRNTVSTPLHESADIATQGCAQCILPGSVEAVQFRLEGDTRPVGHPSYPVRKGEAEPTEEPPGRPAFALDVVQRPAEGHLYASPIRCR